MSLFQTLFANNKWLHPNIALKSRLVQIFSHPTYLGNNKVLIKTIFGDKLILDSRDLSLTPHLIIDRFWEEDNTYAFLKLIKPGMCIIDIGANFGYYTLLGCRLTGQSGSVFSFEANRNITPILKSNISLNGYIDRVSVIDMAVYSKITTLDFFTYKNHFGSSALWEDKEQINKMNDFTEKTKVSAISLDEYFKPDKKIDFLRIDAEGSETHVIEGCKRILKINKNIKIMLEWVPERFHAAGINIENTCSLIEDLGFSPAWIGKYGKLFPCKISDLISRKNNSFTDIVLYRK